MLAHLMLSLGKHAEELIGHQMIDRTGDVHLGLSEYPVVLLEAKTEDLGRVVKRAKQDGALIVDFPRSALDYWTNAELANDLQGKVSEEIEYLGLAICATPQIVNRHTGSLRLLRSRIE